MELLRKFDGTESIYITKTTMERFLDETCQVEVLREFAMNAKYSSRKTQILTNISTDTGYKNQSANELTKTLI